MGQLTLTEEEMQTLEHLVAGTPVLQNAFRLQVDAAFLFEAERYASAIALSILAWEEVGKWLLNTWSSRGTDFRYDRRRYHVMKQLAVACLFVCADVRRSYTKKQLNFSDFDLAGITELSKSVLDGIRRYQSLITLIVNGEIDRYKQGAIYYHDELAAAGREPAKLGKEPAELQIRQTTKAFMDLVDEKAIALGPMFFAQVLEAAEKLKATAKNST
jgi:AbiV family abortive infection protein